MKLTELAVKRPILTSVVYIFLMILSIISLYNLPIDVFPEIEFPALTIVSLYPGSSAKDVEERITKILEESALTLPGIDRVESRSQEGVSAITVIFKWGQNLDVKAQDLRDMIELSKTRLPDDIETPRIFKFDASMMPVMFLTVYPKDTVPNLRYIVDKNLAEEIKKVDGVGAVILRGGDEKEVTITVDPKKLAFYRISIQQLVNSISSENVEMPLGNVYDGYRKYNLRLPMRFNNVDEIKSLIVGTFAAKPVYLHQVATVEDGYKEKLGLTNADGQEAMMLVVRKRSGYNTVSVCRKITQKIEQLQKKYPKLDISIMMDSSEFILKTVKNLRNTILYGGILVILTVLFFMGDFLPALVVVLQIPISLFLSFIFLYLSGFTINIISLSSLSIALGMVVDNSIVVVDHILRHIFKGKSPIDSSIDATGEVGSAITASTLTTIVVFVPLLFVSGLIPILFKQLAYSVIITLLASLFVAFTLSPMIMARFCGCDENKKIGVIFITEFIGKIENFYTEILDWSLKNRRKIVVSFSLLFMISLIVFIFFTGKEFMPKSDEQMLDLAFEGSKGMQLEDTIKISQQIERTIAEKVGKENIFKYVLRVGESGLGGLAIAFGQKESSYSGSMTIKLVEKNKRTLSVFDVAEILRRELRKIAGLVKIEVFVRSTASSTFFGGSKVVSIELRGNDIDRGLTIANELKNNLENINGVRDVTISLEKGSYELWIKLNREKVKMLGLSSYGLADTLRKIYYGITVGRFNPQSMTFENEYDIFVKISKQDKSDLKKLYSLPILLPSGKVVPLNNIADFKREFGPEEILRKDGVRVIKIEADIYARALSEIRKDIDNMLKNYGVPAGFDIKFGGEIKEQQNTFRDLTLMLFLAILLVYLIMVGQFESFVDPFIILFSIPFAVTGVLIALFLWGQNFNVLSFVGLLILIGVVVNNAIVLVDYINLLRNRGMEIFSAIKESGKTRLKPVLMTATTTILGALPLAISNAEGAEYFSSMGVAIIGGLSISTLITLIFVPVVYSIIHTKYIKSKTK